MRSSNVLCLLRNSKLNPTNLADNDVFTEFANVFFDKLANRNIRVLDKWLLHERLFGKVFLQLTFDNFAADLW